MRGSSRTGNRTTFASVLRTVSDNRISDTLLYRSDQVSVNTVSSCLGLQPIQVPRHGVPETLQDHRRPVSTDNSLPLTNRAGPAPSPVPTGTEPTNAENHERNGASGAQRSP